MTPFLVYEVRNLLNVLLGRRTFAWVLIILMYSRMGLATLII